MSYFLKTEIKLKKNSGTGSLLLTLQNLKHKMFFL